MTVEFALALVSLAFFIAAVAVFVIGLCRAASRPAPHPVSPTSLQGRVDALRAMGSEADAVVFDFARTGSGWRN